MGILKQPAQPLENLPAGGFPAGPKLQRITLFESLSAQIEEWILSGELEVGARLPGEGAIADRFHVSRTVVREALARLRERGLVETRAGSGTLVKAPDVAHLQDAILRHLHLLPPTARFVENLYEARTAIEMSTAALAATRATSDDIRTVARHVEDMRSSVADREAFTKADLGFHVGLAAASHNPLLAALLEPLVSVIKEGIYETHRSPSAIQDGLRAHEAILEALSTRDSNRAASEMREHLQDSQKHFMEAFAARSMKNP